MIFEITAPARTYEYELEDPINAERIAQDVGGHVTAVDGHKVVGICGRCRRPIHHGESYSQAIWCKPVHVACPEIVSA